MRLVFMASPDFAWRALSAFRERGHEIAALYTTPPKRGGRGKNLRASAIEELGRAAGLQIETPLSLKDKSAWKRMEAMRADAALVFAYGRLIPQDMLVVPPLGFLNLHLSLLPRWRGAAPVARAIWAGDRKTGVSVMKLDAGLDTGPLLAQQALEILPDENSGALRARLVEMGAPLFVDAVESYALGARLPTPQSAEGALYAEKIKKEETRIDWEEAAENVWRQIKALAPQPAAWCLLPCGKKETRLRILSAKPVKGEGKGGEILRADDHLHIACAEGALEILSVQREGRKPMPIDAFLRVRAALRQARGLHKCRAISFF